MGPRVRHPRRNGPKGAQPRRQERNHIRCHRWKGPLYGKGASFNQWGVSVSVKKLRSDVGTAEVEIAY